MTTIESEYARLKALAEAANLSKLSVNERVSGFYLRIEDERNCRVLESTMHPKAAHYLASAHDMMALIERLMEERKTAERLGPVQGHPHQGCYQSQLGEQTAPISTRDAGPSAFGGRKTRRDNHD